MYTTGIKVIDTTSATERTVFTVNYDSRHFTTEKSALAWLQREYKNSAIQTNHHDLVGLVFCDGKLSTNILLG